ncbi:transcription antitermination factor NusB [Convivina praedatoris]|uniref:Transcription antitermination protein NusB n=1 Tax=Convivina praedatoris TaxID=2880963 RepID=A0ABN8H795_9LACO|nr:transcription antitermination factor NusB [Convivina sp. LMG 32447]CAH1850594.1 Transcription antitermination protein NusB [Convivina sp. LMG 32447]CAH1850606.1 Transcription antitermination protein NusB [Convivina sp. LMG 32447]CAH1850607.1 Transcription antitermination protein NusB [Convivina sp. LMG 32447]
MTVISRHRERQAVFQILFATAKEVPQEDQLDGLYQMVLGDEEFDSFLPQFINGVLGSQRELDQAISQHLVDGWSIKRISRADLVILRMAVYELLYMPEIPYKVAIDEAIELAKEFANPDDAKFVNGILKHFARVEK